MLRRLCLLLTCVVALSACRLDIVTSVVMDPDGTGTVTLTATADAALVAQVPDLVDDLRFEDAISNGWTVEGPTTNDDGATVYVLTHPFRSDQELANVLSSIGPPLNGMVASRTTSPDGLTTNGINGLLQLPNGFASFADADLVAAAGAVPFAEELAGKQPADVMSFTLHVKLPGELNSSKTGTDIGGGVIEWKAPLDGNAQELLTTTVQRPADTGGWWAKPLSIMSLVALVVWSVLSIAFIVFVVFARRAKAKRRALRSLDSRSRTRREPPKRL